MTDQTMIDRVARAHWNARADEYNQWDALDKTERDCQRAAARAAIEAMRAPTSAMVEAGDACEGPAAGFESYGPKHADDVWAAMIDAALKDEPK